MKKLAIILMILVLALSLIGCESDKKEDPNDSTSGSNSSSTSTTEMPTEAEKNLPGLVSHLKSKGFLDGEETKMAAEMIGAVDGVKFASANGAVELYYFDMDNLSADAQATIDNIKSTGQIEMSGFTFPASALKEPFLLLCDESTDKEAIISAFNEY